MFCEDKCRKQAEELVSKMTVDEMASQLRYDAPKIERLKIPAYNWWNEALHGVARAGTATSFPQAIGLAAMFDDRLLERIADVIATEGRAKYNESIKHEDRDIYKGLTFWTPNINIFRDPRWGRGHETYGEDPYLTGELGKAFIRGLQGDGPVMKTAACAKHFAVHSGPEDLRHEFDAVVSDKDLWETYLPAFYECVTKAGVESVMGAYNRTNGEPCCGSFFLLQEVLREKWNFAGHVVSDCWAIRDFHTHHMVTSTAEESAALALKAGCDLNCGNTYLHLLKAFQDGLVTEEEIRESAIRLFTTRFKLGMFGETEYDRISYEVVECREHLDLALEASRRSMVLLKNEEVLPISKDKVKTIGVIGPNADSRLALIGNYYGTSSHYQTFLQGIQGAAGEDIRVLYAAGCHLSKDRTEPLAMENDRLAEALTVAEHSDVVVLCLGLDETLEGEETDEGNHCGSGDKADLLLPRVQRELLEKIAETGKQIVLLLSAGSAIDLTYAKKYCGAILLTFYPGACGGQAAADLLFGKVSPSGKLPVTFYETLDTLPAFTDYSMKNRTYRYYQGRPLYNFGFGLTYGKVKVTDVEIMEEQNLMLKVQIQNTGGMDTEEVVQIYVKDLESVHAVSNYSLCGFQRIFLKESEKMELKIPVSKRHLEVVDENGNRKRESNRFAFYAGVCAPDKESVHLSGSLPVSVMYEIK